MTATARDASWWPLVACSLGSFLLLLHTTVVTVSAPTIGADLGAGYATVAWVIDVYTLALAALVLALGSAGDRWGHRRVFVTGSTVFAVATAACAAAPDGPALVAARAVQGVGGAAVFGTVVPLLTLAYDGPRRPRAFAVWAACSALGSAAGTLAGGLVTAAASWRWLFAATLPVCLLALVAARTLPPAARRWTGGDPLGTAAVTAAAAAVTWAAIDAGEHGWTSAGTVLGATAAVVAVAVLVAVERRAASPLLPPALFGTRLFVAVLLCGFAYYLAAFGALPAISTWLRGSTGAAGAAGMLAVQLAVFVAITLGFGAGLHGRPLTTTLAGGTGLVGVGCLTAVTVLLWPHPVTLVAMLVLTGVGAGVVTPVLPVVAATAVPPSLAGTASAAANAARQLGLTLGIAVCGSIAHTAAAPERGLAAALAVAGVVAVVGAGAVAAMLATRPSCGVSDG